MRKRTKIQIVVFFFLKKRPKRGKRGRTCRRLDILGFRERERESSFSLKYHAIRPSTIFGARRKAALHGKGFAWIPDLRSLDKLLEVGVSSYLGLVFV